MKSRTLAALLVAGAAGVLLYGFTRPRLAPAPLAPEAPGGVEGSSEPVPPSRAEGPAQPEPHPHVAAAPPPAPGSAAPGSHPEPALGGAHTASPPLSAVAHRVLRSWGGAAGSRAPRGLLLVVEPSLGTGELEQLLRDAVSQHAEADVLTIRIYDSEEAASYDRHGDGGALAERHLVASMSRHRRLGVESLRVRGVELAP